MIVVESESVCCFRGACGSVKDAYNYNGEIVGSLEI